MLKLVYILAVLFLFNHGYSQIEIKWSKQHLQITLPNSPEEIDTLDEEAYFEYVDEDYDFAFEMIKKGDDDFSYKKDLYAYAQKEMKETPNLYTYGRDELRTGKLEGLNSFYAITMEEETDKKTGLKYQMVIGEFVFFHPNKKKLYYFDVEFDGKSMDKVEAMIQSIKFYE